MMEDVSMMMDAQASGRPLGGPMTRRLGMSLVEAGLLSVANLEAALYEQRHQPGLRLGEILLRMELIERQELMRALDELAEARRREPLWSDS